MVNTFILITGRYIVTFIWYIFLDVLALNVCRSVSEICDRLVLVLEREKKKINFLKVKFQDLVVDLIVAEQSGRCLLVWVSFYLPCVRFVSNVLY